MRAWHDFCSQKYNVNDSVTLPSCSIGHPFVGLFHHYSVFNNTVPVLKKRTLWKVETFNSFVLASSLEFKMYCCMSAWLPSSSIVVLYQKIFILPARMVFWFKCPHPSGNFSLVSYLPLKNILAFKTPLPFAISSDHPWGGYGYFLEPHILRLTHWFI